MADRFGDVVVPDDLAKETMRVSQLVPYIGNAKKHPDWQVEQIASSIRAFGFNDPIAVWKDVAGHWVIVEGHGRLLAAKSMGMDEVPVIRLDHLDDEARRAYTLVHNKLTMNTDFDVQIVDSELDAIEGFDMTEFGFEAVEDDGFYTSAINPPQYEPVPNDWTPSDLYDDGKAESLRGALADADITEEERAFLEVASYRHVVFDYARIADYYSTATPAMQKLMEDSALVIIDPKDAIANGYMRLSKKLEELRA